MLASGKGGFLGCGIWVLSKGGASNEFAFGHGRIELGHACEFLGLPGFAFLLLQQPRVLNLSFF
jgi:hypothetical protein